MDEQALIIKLSKILGVSQNAIQWDLPYVKIIKLLVQEYENLAEKAEVEIYEC
jgi:hypothetical protein